MRIYSIFIVCFLLSGCKNNSTQNNSITETTTHSIDTTASIVTATVSEDNAYQQTALYLAGLATDADKKINPSIIQNDAYRLFSDSLSRGFENMETSRLSKMRDWAKTELIEEQSAKTVFYPFSGPDILHCIQFYPNADQYILIALEKYGSLPTLEKMDTAKALQYLSSVTSSLEDIFGKSYFITRKMLKDVSNRVNGFVPLASVFLVRSGFEIKDVQYKHLNDDGSFADISFDSCGKKVNDLVEIYFTKKGENHLRKVVYFRTNLCDDKFGGMASFADNKTLQNFLNGLPEFYTYVKSASYLMNYPSFDIIRKICLAKSKSILQDDTGVALRYLEKSKWAIKLFGNYVKPVSDFTGVWQEDLKAAYVKDSLSIQKLPFSLGYHWGDQNTQNLMKFTKK
jgi:hypothetical protein